jgi:hypothetical protein
MASLVQYWIGKLNNPVKHKNIPSWKEIEYFDENWKLRIREMSSFIPEHTESIMDVGCGKMWLKDFIPPDCKYFGIDYVIRGNDSYVFDLNNYEFPAFFCDVAFISGCLEYIEDYKWLISKIASQNKACIISYCTLDFFSSLQKRRELYWKNNLREKELINLFEANNMFIQKKIKSFNNDSIFIFRK